MSWRRLGGRWNGKGGRQATSRHCIGLITNILDTQETMKKAILLGAAALVMAGCAKKGYQVKTMLEGVEKTAIWHSKTFA